MNTKVITGGVIIILIIIGVIYYMSRTSPIPAADTASTTDQSQTANASSTLGQVQGQDVSIGTGEMAAPGMIVDVLYEGKLQDGTVFDSSAAHGNKPLSFTLGTDGLIPGFQIGVNGMKVGGERILVIPPTLGYGDQDVKDDSGKVIIPANSTLVFNIKLVGVKAASSTPTTP